MSKLSIIIPVLNEEHFLARHREAYLSLIRSGHQILVVDGGSQDGSIRVASELGCEIFSTKASRGYQMHFGAKRSRHDMLLFLHADTLLPPHAAQMITRILTNPAHPWGRFSVRFSDPRLIFRIIAWLMNRRSSLTGIVTGDHAMFVQRASYFKCGGYLDIPIMEDVEFSRRLKKHAPPACLSDAVITSSRKWEQHGIFRMMLTMWKLRLMYFLGVAPEKIVKLYQ